MELLRIDDQARRTLEYVVSDAKANKENPRIGGILVLGFVCGIRGNLPAAEIPKAGWQAEWEKTVKQLSKKDN